VVQPLDVHTKYTEAERLLHNPQGGFLVFVNLQGPKGGEVGGAAVVDARYDVVFTNVLGGQNMRNRQYRQKPDLTSNLVVLLATLYGGGASIPVLSI
jgi:hypothetical protein